jgi:hypothetical protein
MLHLLVTSFRSLLICSSLSVSLLDSLHESRLNMLWDVLCFGLFTPPADWIKAMLSWPESQKRCCVHHITEYMVSTCPFSVIDNFDHLATLVCLSFYFSRPSSVWNQPFPLGALAPFSIKWLLKAKIWVCSVLTAPVMCFSAVSVSKVKRGVCVCACVYSTYTHIYTHIRLFPYHFVYICLKIMNSWWFLQFTSNTLVFHSS